MGTWASRIKLVGFNCDVYGLGFFFAVSGLVIGKSPDVSIRWICNATLNPEP